MHIIHLQNSASNGNVENKNVTFICRAYFCASIRNKLGFEMHKYSTKSSFYFMFFVESQLETEDISKTEQFNI